MSLFFSSLFLPLLVVAVWVVWVAPRPTVQSRRETWACLCLALALGAFAPFVELESIAARPTGVPSRGAQSYPLHLLPLLGAAQISTIIT